MPSPEALRLDDLLRAAPKMLEMDLAQRRAAGEHAEDMTIDPAGVTFEEATAVGGLWAIPADAIVGDAILYLFGGGYVISSPHSRRKLAGHLGRAARARGLVPAYRLAPEHPFPGAVEDATAAYRWLLGQGYEPRRIAIAGDSSGGGLTVATLLNIRDQGLPMPAGAVSISPWADLAFTGSTYEACAGVDLTVTLDGLQAMAAQYLGGTDARAPLASPVYADLSGLPPLLIMVGGHEILLDDAVRLARSAGMAGVDVSLFIGAGMQHIYPIYAGLLPESDAAVAMIGAWVRARLG